MFLYSHTLCTCARMEEDSIVEWVEYHLTLGFDHIYVYSNDDNHDTLLSVLLPFLAPNNKYVTYIHCAEKGAQFKMYCDFLKYHGYKSKYICFLDQDEYIVLKKYSSISALTSDYRDFDSIEMNWMIYGNSYYSNRPKGGVLNNYKYRKEKIDVHTKHISKSSAFFNGPIGPGFHHSLNLIGNKKITNIMPQIKPFSTYFLVNDEEKANHRNAVEDLSLKYLDELYIAHFAIKSENDFIKRIERGLSGDFEGQNIWSQFLTDSLLLQNYLKDTNKVYDDWLSNYWYNYKEGIYKFEPKFNA